MNIFHHPVKIKKGMMTSACALLQFYCITQCYKAYCVIRFFPSFRWDY